MKNIIERLYAGELCPADECETFLEKHKDNYEMLAQMEDEIEACLNEIQKMKLKLYLEKEADITKEELSNAFYQGFRTAVQLIFQGLK